MAKTPNLHPERMHLLEQEAREFKQLGADIREAENVVAEQRAKVRKWRRRRVALLLQARRRYWEHRRHLVA